MRLTKPYLRQIIKESLQSLREVEEIPLPGAEAEAEPEAGSKRVRDVEQSRTQTQNIALGKTAKTAVQAKEDFDALVGGVLQNSGGEQSEGFLVLPVQTLVVLFKQLLVGDAASGRPGIHPDHRG